MTDKELRKLSRAELIDIIYELQKQNSAAEAENARLRAELDDRTLRLANAGSIAEAALELNGVFTAAQAAADNYLNSLRSANAETEKKILTAKRSSEKIIADAEARAQQIIDGANRQAQQKWDEVNIKIDSVLKTRDDLRELMKKD